MIALTKEKREELIADCRKAISDAEVYIRCHGEDKCIVSLITRSKLALASLMAAPSGYRWFHDGSPETRGWYASCYPLDNDYLERCLVDKSIHSHEPLYTAPPVPEIKLPHELLDLVNAVEFYQKVKAENPEIEVGAWNDAYDWIKKAAVEAAPVIKNLNILGY